MIRLLFLALALLLSSSVRAQEDEDHQRVCPLLTEAMVHVILPEVTGHGACKVRCSGCGCKGGPGYRDQKHNCVSYANIIQRCGPPPHLGCIAECAPVRDGCDHGRVWLKDVLAKAGLAAHFTVPTALTLPPAQQQPLEDTDQPGNDQTEH
jgi:hypothetical protein